MSEANGKYMVFDVESIGLHGDAYAVGYVVIEDGKEIESGCFACSPENADGEHEDREWVSKNIPEIPINAKTTFAVRCGFWEKWMFWKRAGARLVTDCGWPVEANFLSQCIADASERKWNGPYPLLDLSSVLLANEADPVGVFDRLPNELPKHDPVCDARQSARIFYEFLSGEKNL